jgi:LPXTG-site transpeptidase (sortase) family protein
MTAIATWPLRRRPRAPAVALPPLSARLQLARAALVVCCVLCAASLAQLVIGSALQQRAAQQQLFDRFRAELAQGTAPLGPTDVDGAELAPGHPVAYLEIPSLGLRQVVVEGTSAAELFAGPGHRRDTPLPGQAGVSVVFGRRAAFGGPFAHLHDLAPGELIRVTTGQGTFEYRASGLRRAGDPAPVAPAPGEGRLTLTTADGSPFLPDGVLRVDAELSGDAAPAVARLVDARRLPSEEQALAVDARTLWALALWLQALLATALAAVWAWHRWGRAQAWVVFLPPLLLAGQAASNEATRLLPNLL